MSDADLIAATKQAINDLFPDFSSFLPIYATDEKILYLAKAIIAVALPQTQPLDRDEMQ